MDSNFYNQIEDWLNNRLNPDDKKMFETALTKDRSLQKAVEDTQLMEQFLQKKPYRDALRQQLEQLGKVHFQAEKEIAETSIVPITKDKISWIQWLSIAASVVLFVFVLATYFLPEDTLNDSVAMHYPPLNTLERSAYDENKLAIIEENFNTGKFAIAYQQFKTIDSLTTQLQVYQSITAIEINHPEEAIETLKPIATGTSSYQTMARFYLARAYCNANQLQQCRAILKEIPESDDFRPQAEELLKERF